MTLIRAFQWLYILVFALFLKVFLIREHQLQDIHLYGTFKKVLTYLSTIDIPEHLNDKMLILKTTMVIALIPSTTAHEICSLNIDFLVKLPTHYTFHFPKIKKLQAKVIQLS